MEGRSGRETPVHGSYRLARAGERFGQRKIAAMLIGDTDELPPLLASLSTTGLLRGWDPRSLERWIEASCAAGLVRTSDDEYRTLRLTPLGRDVMAGREEQVRMAPPVERERAGWTRRKKRRLFGSAGGGETGMRFEHWPAPAPAGGAPSVAAEAIDLALREWRRDEARRRGVAPYLVLHDRTIEAIAAAAPRTADALAHVSGIGPAKLAEFGDVIVSVVARAGAGAAAAPGSTSGD